MAIKFAKSFGAEVTLLSTSSFKKQDALALGADQFVVTTEEFEIQKLAGYFDLFSILSHLNMMKTIFYLCLKRMVHLFM